MNGVFLCCTQMRNLSTSSRNMSLILRRTQCDILDCVHPASKRKCVPCLRSFKSATTATLPDSPSDGFLFKTFGTGPLLDSEGRLMRRGWTNEGVRTA